MAQSLKEKKKDFFKLKIVSSTYIKSANLDQRKKGLVFQLRRTEQVPQWTMEEPTTTSVRFKMGDQVRRYHLQEGLGFGTLRDVQVGRGLKSVH